MYSRQFTQYFLGLAFLVMSSLASSNNGNIYTTSDGWPYKFFSGGIEILGCSENCPNYDMVIPSTLNGYSVKSIGSHAFNGNVFTTLTIPDSVINIGDYAFANNRLVSVNLGANIVSIGEYAFANSDHPCLEYTWGCESFSKNLLTIVTIPDSVTSIGEAAFLDNQLTSITIPDSVTAIGDGAFSGNQLTSVTIPASLNSFGDYAFENNQLTNVTIAYGVTGIGYNAFENNQLNSVSIPGSVTSIGAEAFKNNQLTNIFLAEGIQSIEDKAFANNLLTSVSIPSSVFNLRRDAFSGNTGVIGGEWRYIERLGDAMLLGCADSCPSDMIIPEYIDGFHVQSIDDEAFLEEGLNSIRFPDGIVHVGQNAFLGNPLTSVTYCRSDNSDWGFGDVEGITPQLDDSCNISDELNESVTYATFDIDQSGSVDALSDGLILLRYFFGLRGDSLISGVISPDANRTSAADIEAYIESHMP